jgi:hypothetical protein
MGAKLCPKLILEGTRLTQKTELAFALSAHPRIVGPRKYRYHSPLISAEWGGLTNVPWGKSLLNFGPEEEAQALETYATWARLFELLPYDAWLVDRFHLSTRSTQQAMGRADPDFSALEARLRPLGFRHILCTRRDDTFEAARAERLKVSGNPRQYDDLRPFLAEQQRLRELVRGSALPFLELDVSALSPHGAADQVADWLEATGALSAPWGAA